MDVPVVVILCLALSSSKDGRPDFLQASAPTLTILGFQLGPYLTELGGIVAARLVKCDEDPINNSVGWLWGAREL